MLKTTLTHIIIFGNIHEHNPKNIWPIQNFHEFFNTNGLVWWGC